MHFGRYSERGSDDDWEGFITIVGVDWLVDVSEILRVLGYGRHAIEGECRWRFLDKGIGVDGGGQSQEARRTDSN